MVVVEEVAEEWEVPTALNLEASEGVTRSRWQECQAMAEEEEEEG